MSYGEGVYGEGVYGDAATTGYNATGIGAISLTGHSIVATNYRASGVGIIDLTGQSVVATNYRASGVGVIYLTGQSTASKSYEAFGVGIIDLSGQSLIATNYRASGVGVIDLTGQSLVESGLIAIQEQWISTHYRCYLTGAADGLDDLEMPLKSFQTRFGSDPYRVYLSIVVPGVNNYTDGIAARPNGSLTIYKIYNYSDGSSAQFLLASSIIDTIQTNEGAKSGTTGNISGYLASTAGNAHSINLSDPVTRSVENSVRRYRCAIDPRLRPLDTVTINGETFQVDQIIHIIDTTTAIMEIKELAA